MKFLEIQQVAIIIYLLFFSRNSFLIGFAGVIISHVMGQMRHRIHGKRAPLALVS